MNYFGAVVLIALSTNKDVRRLESHDLGVSHPPLVASLLEGGLVGVHHGFAIGAGRVPSLIAGREASVAAGVHSWGSHRAMRHTVCLG